MVAWSKMNLKALELMKSGNTVRTLANLNIEFFEETGFCFEVFDQTIKHLLHSNEQFSYFVYKINQYQ